MNYEKNKRPRRIPLAFYPARSGSVRKRPYCCKRNYPVWAGFFESTFCGSFTQFADAGKESSSQIKHKFVPSWNDLVVNEREKFDLKKAYSKENVIYDLDIVTKRNAAVDVSEMTSLNAQADRIKKEDIASIVMQDKTSKKGIGLVYIVDTYSKPDEKGEIWVSSSTWLHVKC